MRREINLLDVHMVPGRGLIVETDDPHVRLGDRLVLGVLVTGIERSDARYATGLVLRVESVETPA